MTAEPLTSDRAQSRSAVGAPDTPATVEVLDNPAWNALLGEHARFAHRHGGAARYPDDVAPFAALRDGADPAAWADLGVLVGPGVDVAVTSPTLTPPSTWEVLDIGQGVQLTGELLDVADDPEAVRLSAGDVPEILDLVARTQPGPFRPRTIELGTYLGIRRGGALIAVAGERLHPPGWTEISAVCTDPAYRGQGLATRLVRAVAAGIRRRGELPFLHAAATNTTAVRLYEHLGFRLRRRTTFALTRLRKD
ncbi:GNAT family N-acetyltransferase [Hamadaea tsunoensis]|uniref:GNAT family N-acetyltransferase n=1 Tax=Hamadaea tsunoensis TaxID=53368 RepID=UPI00041F328B|nr:GNAT family N-acetyltransferase [Hamadaea tsunoensis]